MRTLRRTLYRPWCPPAPAWAVKFGFPADVNRGVTRAEGRRCAPKRFLKSGFQFKFAGLHAALKDIYP